MVIESNKISLTLQDTDAMKNIGVSVPNAKDGDISRVSRGVTMDGLVHKEAGNATSVYTEAEARQYKEQEVVLPTDSQMSPADFISRCTTGEDAKAVSDEGTPLEEYTSSQLDRAISRIKQERREKEDAIEHQVDREREEAEAIDEAAVQNAAREQVSSQIQAQMQQSGLPVTSENMMRLSHAIEMAAGIHSFSEGSMKFFISQNLSVTPENISGSMYSVQGEQAEAAATEESTFAEVEEQVRDVLSEYGVEPDEETLETAKWLYDNNLPVTLEHVKTCEKLAELKETDSEVLTARIIDSMADGVRPEKANLLKISVAEAITARRQLEEIRLSMSIEAVRNMSAKGIDLDISNLKQIVDELRVQEQQAKEAMLQETGLPVTDENKQLMSDTIQAAKQVLAAPAPFLGEAMEAQDTDTLRQLSEKAVNFTDSFARAEQSYEAVGTEVRRDLGDSIQKAFTNVDSILLDLNMECTAQNQRAVRSLAYNQIPLTEENIVRMKEYDTRITSLMETMKPPVVAELIRRGINPLEISLDELGAEDIAFSKYIWKLEHQKAITPEERETMIGVYRLLDKIEKSDGAAAGQLMKEGRELSLQSLLSAVRTRRDSGMDVQIDDDFGGLEQTIANSTSISEQIQSAYRKQVARQLRECLSPEVLREYAEEDMTLEQLLELSRSSVGEEAEYYQQMVSEWQETLSGAQEQVKQFLAQLDLPDTMANLQLAQNFLKQGNKDFTTYWEPEDSGEILEAMEQPEQLDEVYEALDKRHEEALAKVREKDDIEYVDIHSMAMMNNRISFYGKLRNYQMYEVPVITEQGVTTCNVTVQSDASQKKGTVEIVMESFEFGRLQASFKLSGNRIKGFVTVADKEQVANCQTRMDEFEKDLEERGFTMDGNSLIAGSRDSLLIGDRAEGAKNTDLYRIAKTFIIAMSRKDDAA